jgi:hypothetical protein
MFYKSILNAVAVAVAVVAVMFVGCGSDDEGGGGGGGDLAGDWLVVSEGDRVLSDDAKMFFSFKSNTLEVSEFGRISNFWLVYTQEPLEYRLKDGNSICIVIYDGGGYEGDNCLKYSISGNNLTITETYQHCDENGECHSSTSTLKAKRDDLAAFRSSNNIKSRDPALMNTRWVNPSEDGENEWERASIDFWGNYNDSREVYLSNSYYAVWYTEGSHLTLVGLECDRYETVVEDGYEWERCVSYSESETKTLDYELTNGTLRLRASGGDWDVWTPSDGYYFSQSKAKSKTGSRAIIPFWAFRR